MVSLKMKLRNYILPFLRENLPHLPLHPKVRQRQGAGEAEDDEERRRAEQLVDVRAAEAEGESGEGDQVAETPDQADGEQQ